MLTFQQLFNGTRSVRNKVNPTGSFTVTRAMGLPFIHALAVQGQFEPFTETDVAYHEVSIIFHDMRFSEVRNDTYNFQVDVVPNVRMWTHRPSFEASNVQVRCTCSDYYFVWWIQCSHFGSLAGPPMELYVRLTPPPPQGRPYKNPGNHPGLCKHLLRFTRYLVEKGLVIYP